MRRRFIDYTLTHEHEQLLRQTTIDENGPGSILRDIESFLSFISEQKGQKLQITQTYNLRLRYLRELNARFTTPLQLGLTRPQQKSYPHIHGLYLLIRASGLMHVEEHGKRAILTLNQTAIDSWRRLNPTERYMTLLETWFIRADPEIIGERGNSFGSLGNLDGWGYLFRAIPEAGWAGSDSDSIRDTIKYSGGDYNLGLLDLFGFVKTDFGPPLPKTSWYLTRLEPTPLGDAFLALLMTKFQEELEYHWVSLEENDNILKSLRAILQPYFPELQKPLTIISQEDAYQQGTHIFKVSLHDAWRRIAISATHDFDVLAFAILAAFDFDDDEHLYYFTYHDRYGIARKISHPDLEREPLTDSLTIGELALQPKQQMTFIFDLGEDWTFHITLESIDTDMTIEQPTLLETHGEAPEQHGYWGGDEEE